MPVIAKALGHKMEQHSVTGIYARLNDNPVGKAIETAVNEMLSVAGQSERG